MATTVEGGRKPGQKETPFLKKRAVQIGLGVSATLAAGLVGFNALRRSGGESNVVINHPVATEPAIAPVINTPELSTPIPTVAPTVEATPEVAAVQLPDVISSETVTFENLSPLEVNKLVDEAAARGETKIPLPDILEQDGVSLSEAKSKNNGRGGLVLSGGEPGEYKLQSIADGEITQSEFTPGGSMAGIEVTTKTGERIGYIVPVSSLSDFKVGDRVALGDTLLLLNYNPNTPEGKEFIESVQRQIDGVPEGVMALIASADSSGQGATITRDNILTTLNGSPIVVSPPAAK